MRKLVLNLVLWLVERVEELKCDMKILHQEQYLQAMNFYSF